MGGKKTSITNHIKRIRLARTDFTQAGLARRGRLLSRLKRRNMRPH